LLVSNIKPKEAVVNQNLWKRASPSQEKSCNRKSKEQLLRKSLVKEEGKPKPKDMGNLVNEGKESSQKREQF